MSEPNDTRETRNDFESVKIRDVAVAARFPSGLAQVCAWPGTMEAVDEVFVSILGTCLPTGPGGSTTMEDRLIMAIAPGTFLIEAGEPDIAGKLAEIIETAVGTVTNLSDSRVALVVAGAGAERLLSKGLAIDLDLGRFPVGRVLQSTIDEIGIIIRRVAALEFDLYVYQSFALDLRGWLIEANQ
jgi:heterotetrameric sarcosine oxidase gamma subunit